MKYYTGLDLHKRYSEITIIDENGKIIKQDGLKEAGYEIKLAPLI